MLGSGRVVYRTLTFLAGLLWGWMGANDLAAAGSSNTVSAVLEYSEYNGGVSWADWDRDLQSVQFKKEPDFGGRKVVRGLMHFSPDAAHSIPFIWDKQNGKLYLDLNRNRNLTDDPAGVYSTVTDLTSDSASQMFEKVVLTFSGPFGTRRLIMRINMFTFCKGDAQLCSCWQGKVVLQGDEICLRVFENTLRSPEASLPIMRLESKRLGIATSLPWPETDRLFFQGQAYRLSRTRPTEATGQYRVAFVQEQPVMGEVKISGRDVSMLVLDGPYKMVLASPSDRILMPVGKYSTLDVCLRNGEATANLAGAVGVEVTGSKPALLEVGGPLSNVVVVTVSVSGTRLKLDYKLVGAGGRAYRLTCVEKSKPPQFRIYHGEKLLESGTFEYG